MCQQVQAPVYLVCLLATQLKRYLHSNSTSPPSRSRVGADMQANGSAMSSDDAETFSPSHLQRSASPAPTSDFSIIDVDVETFPSIHYQQALTYERHSPLGHATTDYDTSSNEYGHSGTAAYASIGGSHFTGVTDDTFQGSYPFDAVNSVEGQDDIAGKGSPHSLRTLLPRIWEALSSPGKSLFPSVTSPSSCFAPSPPFLPSSPFTANGTSPRRKGKGKAKLLGPDWDSDVESPFIDYSELAPLDGEEGELIDDEACFIDVRAVTGIGELTFHSGLRRHPMCQPHC